MNIHINVESDLEISYLYFCLRFTRLQYFRVTGLFMFYEGTLRYSAKEISIQTHVGYPEETNIFVEEKCDVALLDMISIVDFLCLSRQLCGY